MLAHGAAWEVFKQKKSEGKIKGQFGIKVDGVSRSKIQVR